MRKRLRDAIYLKDNSQGGGKQRRKLKVSERLARQLEICERTINDAQNCYEELKTLKLQPESKHCTGFANYQPLPAIPVDISSSAVSKQNYLPIPMLPDASASLLSSPIEHAPILECKSGILMDEVDNLAVKGRFDMQYKQSPQLPCQGVALAEASQVFVSFLQRLTQHGVVLQLPTTPHFVKETLIGCRAGATQVPGLMGLNEADTAETSPLNFYRGYVTEEPKELEPEKASLAKYSRDEKFALEAKVVACSQMNVFEESKKADPEKSLLLELSQEKVADKLYAIRETEELKVGEADERQDEDEFLVPGGGGKVVSESDIEDDDGLKHLWNAMDFSLACMNEIENSQVEAGNNKNDGCIHDFYKRDDMGLVCSKCGLIGQDAEYIFNFVWGEKSSKRHCGKEPTVAKKRTMALAVQRSDEVENLCVHKSTVKALVLHPRYKDKLRMHQEEGLRFLEHNLVRDEPNGCILAHAPGTGKSFTIIAFLQSFQTAFPNEKPLIVAPKGMLSVWVREFHKWKVDNIVIFNLQEAKSVEGEDYSDTDALGHQLKRHRQLQMLRQWKAEKSVLMVGYSTFSTLTGEKASAFPEIKKLLVEAPGILILDEGHFPRNKKAQITQSLSLVHTKRRVLLSGTLFQNNFDELYNLYYLVKPDFMSSNHSCTKGLLENFMKAKTFSVKGGSTPSKSPRKRSGREAVELDIFKYLGDTIRYGDEEEKRQAIGQLRQLSEPFVHWYKGEILADLPGLFDLTLYLKLTDKQQGLLLSLPSKTEKQLDFFTKIMRVCIHPVLLKVDYDAAHCSDIQWDDSEEDPRNSSKIMFILDLLQLAVPMKEKVVLFSKYLDPFYLLERVLRKAWGWHLNKEILKIEGRTSLEERECTIDRFNEDSKAKILFASIKTCGEGVSLIGASRIVLLDVQWNPMVSRQAISRAFRIGQRKKVFVYRLVVEGTKEEEAHLRACEKEWLAKQIFEGCRDEDYSLYCHEVVPQEVDMYFEKPHLRENVVRCIRYRFV